MKSRGAFGSEAHRARFWSYVVKSDGCWRWTGNKNNKGYGMTRFPSDGSGRRAMLLAHRVAYELTQGPIPEGLEVCHSCDNPECVRPDHLWLGTRAENTADCREKRRHVYGTRQPGAKLRVADVLQVRSSVASVTTLAAQFGVSVRHVYRVRSGERWPIVDGLDARTTAD